MSEAQDLNIDAAADAIVGMWEQKGSSDADPVVDADEPVEGEPETEEEAPEGDAEDAESEEETEEPEAEEEAPAEVETLADLAKQLDVPIEELSAKLKHTVKVDGEELQVTLDELTAGYQKDQDYRQKTQTLARERDVFASERQQVFERFHAEHTTLAQLIGLAEQQLVGEINSQELAQLRITNEPLWAARRLAINDRVEQMRQVKQAAANQYVERQKENESIQAAKLAEKLDSERELVRNKIPQFDAIKPKLTSYLKGQTYGFTDADIGGVMDHRLLIMAQKAMLYDEGASKALSVVKNKVIPAPKKPLQPSKPMSKVAITRARMGSARNALKKSGSIDDAAKVILQSGLLNPKR